MLPATLTWLANDLDRLSAGECGLEHATSRHRSEGTAFVSELNPGGTALLYSTYLGGTGNGTFGEFGGSDCSGHSEPCKYLCHGLYIFAGFSGEHECLSSGNPVRQEPATAGRRSSQNLNLRHWRGAAGYSSYLGGDTFDDGHGIAVDTSRERFHSRGNRIHGFSDGNANPLLKTPPEMHFSRRSIRAQRLVQLHLSTPRIWAEPAREMQLPVRGHAATE